MLLITTAVFAQHFGGNPPAIRWQAIELKKTSIIFPQGFDSTGSRVATLLQRIDNLQDSSIGDHRRKLSLILQPLTTVSNGYVALAPFRSEFMLTSPANPFSQGSITWTDQLALHEYRHVEQYSNFNRGLAKVFSILLGQQGQAFANALTVPDWFFEGDAVYQETFLSRQGRGRLPNFYEGYRAIWEAGTHYRYMKLRNGSLVDFVPGHYDLGYQLVAYGRNRYGNNFWKPVTQDAAAMKGLFYPLQRAVRKSTGRSFPEFADSALNKSRSILVAHEAGQRDKQPVVNEENPFTTEAGELLFLKSSYKRVAAFYLRKDGKEEKIRTKDRGLDNYFSYAGGLLVYAAYRPDARWGWKDYSELQLLDIHSGKQKRITRNTRYFSPALSPSSDSIVAVYNDPGAANALDLLDAAGRLLRRLPNTGNYVYAHPAFAGDKIVVAVRNASAQMNLLAIDLHTGVETLLFHWANTVIGYPRFREGSIYFTASTGGVDRIFSCTTDGKGLQQWDNTIADSSRLGQYQPDFHKGALTWMQFSANGQKIIRVPAGSLRPKPVPETALSVSDPLQVAALVSSWNDLSAPGQDTGFAAHRYRKTTRLFQFHSWLPYYEEPEFSFSVMSQNPLNTFQSALSFVYNRNEGYKQFGFSGTYAGWFPWLQAGVNYTIDRRGIFQQREIFWNETELSLGVGVPLNLSRGRSIRNLSGSVKLVYDKTYFHEPEKSQIGNPDYYYLDEEVRFTNQSLQAVQQFNPPFAQTLRLHYRHAIKLFDSEQLLATTNLYFPGLFPNHSIVLNGAGQFRDSTSGIRFTDEMPFARGYNDVNYYRSLKWGVNYALPLFYPDAGLFQIVYLLRVRANVFYDHAYAKDVQLLQSADYQQFRSTGIELLIDSKWWNQLPVSFGIRYSRLLDPDRNGYTGSNRFEFILPVNLIPAGVNSKTPVVQ
ncbi:hypothetical protein FPE01S_02_08250 [Flavihumibacter petaseus NBRC 106054]|uniref:Uncharacterized protein n=2 Tax=Flavihumibacter TaxID=1004301 RepID=A0A0E9N1J1_9BACT|nr:hypothetical protein FPE01S_02_08250 [Flavihumibacter petaseus NBRC 106054]